MFLLHIKKLLGRAILIAAAIGGGCALLYAGILLVMQGAAWLKTGQWPPRSIANWFWESFQIQIGPTEWFGFNKISAGFLGLHVCVLMILIAVACFICAGYGMTLAEHAERDMLLARQGKSHPQ
jgi:hypothetical protein